MSSRPACSGLDAGGAPQEGRQMSGAVVGISGDLGDRLGRAAGPRVIEAGDRGRNAVASRRGAAPVPASAAVFSVALLGVFLLATRFAVPVRAAVRFARVVLDCVGAF